MKIAVATNMGGLKDEISPVFGRCQNFTIIEAEDREIKDVRVVPNRYAGGVSGVGIQVAQFIVEQGANVAIAGNYGPNVTNVLNQARIEMIIASGQVEDAVKKYLYKELRPIEGPTSQPQMPYGGGMGRGRGGGRGMGGGMYGGQRPFQQPPQPFQPAQPASKDEEIQMLERQAEDLQKQLDAIKKRIEELKR